MDVLRHHKSLQYVFTQSELNVFQRRWFDILKEYYMNVHHHPDKANTVTDALSRMSMRSTSHVKDGNKEFVKDIHRLASLGVRLVDSTSGGVSVNPNS